MTNQTGGLLVRVTTKGLGQGQERIDEYYVAEGDPRKAEELVSQYIRALDEEIKALGPLTQSFIDALGLKPGEIRKWP
jgi:hypothetical protein